MRNWQTGIITVRHLPVVEDNIIAFNRASGIQGGDVRSTAASVNHNTIAFNANHGIALGGNSNILIENNVIAYNERFGLKILEDAEAVRVTNNNLYSNLRQIGGVPDGNFSFDPAFISPRSKMNFEPSAADSLKTSDIGSIVTPIDSAAAATACPAVMFGVTGGGDWFGKPLPPIAEVSSPTVLTSSPLFVSAAVISLRNTGSPLIFRSKFTQVIPPSGLS